MERVQLKPSRSAPDLTDLLEARSFESEERQQHDGLNGHTSEDDEDEDDDTAHGIDGVDDEHDNDEANRHRWRRNHLPTPSPSRSPTPEISRRNGPDYGRTMDEADACSFRLRSETPEVYNDSHIGDEDGSTRAYLRRAYSGRLRDSHAASESDAAPHHATEESTSPSPSTPTSPTSPNRPRGLSNARRRFLPTSLWDYLQEEISASELDGSQEMKAERVTNFFSVPMAVEQVCPSLSLRTAL